MNAAWTAIRVKGGEHKPQDFPPLAGDHALIEKQAQCPSCGRNYAAGDVLIGLPLGPGDDLDDRRKHRQRGWYSAMALLLHRECYGSGDQPGLATLILGASSTLNEAADELELREKEARVEGREGDGALSDTARGLAERIDKLSQETVKMEETT